MTIMTDDDVAAEATRLDEAERTRCQVRQTTLVYPDATVDDAYRVQAAWRELRLARGERIVGHKIGLTSKAMQTAMNIATPDSGFLTDAMVFEPDSELDAGAFCDPRLEVELAFVLGADLEVEAPGRLSVDDVLDATDHVRPAIELIAARSHRVDPGTRRTRTVIDTIADNAADAGIVLGGTEIAPHHYDLSWIGATATLDGEVVETGLAAAVLGHPARGVIWLAERHAAQGRRLRRGDVVLAGSFTSPLPVRPGSEFAFDFGSGERRLGAFTLRFT